MSKVTATFGDLGNIIASVPFLNENPIVQGVKERVKGALDYIGLDAAAAEVPEEYLIKIKSSMFNENIPVITAKMQEKINIRIGSEWAPLLPENGLTDLANSVMQLTTGKAAVASVQSRRIWKGNEPVTMTMKMRFYAQNDPYKEVLFPCIKLQQLISPSKIGNVELFSKIPLLAPPGPSPFKTSEAALQKLSSAATSVAALFGIDASEANSKINEIAEALTEGDQITINFGRFLTFDSVIIKDVSVSFENKFTVEGYPIGAEADVVFQTYEIMTKESIATAYAKEGQVSNIAKEKSIFSSITDKIDAASNKIFPKKSSLK